MEMCLMFPLVFLKLWSHSWCTLSGALSAVCFEHLPCGRHCPWTRYLGKTDKRLSSWEVYLVAGDNGCGEK